MDGFVMAGKAFAVCEDLRLLAEQNKGKTVVELLNQHRRESLYAAVAKQFGVSVEELKIQLGVK
jgi:hypothetical protein